MAIKCLSWNCPKCGLKIESIWENQFQHNKRQHIEKHERENITEGVKQAKDRIKLEKRMFKEDGK